MNDDLAASYAHCRMTARRARSNFYLAFWSLSREKHAAMCALYCFLRGADDAADAEGAACERKARLDCWRESLERALVGQCDGPTWRALADTAERYHIPHSYFREALAGAEMDLGTVSYSTFKDLETYCYRVAGVVGLCCLHIWGFRGEQAASQAIACGTAFQLTNILRDLKEDAEQHRCYLPQEELARFGYSADDLGGGVRNQAFMQLMQFQIQRARYYFAQADGLEGCLESDGQRVLRAMRATYEGLLTEIERRSGDVFTARVQLGFGRRLWLAARALWPASGPHFAPARTVKTVSAPEQAGT